MCRYLAERDLVRADAAVSLIGDGHSNIIYLVDDGERRVIVRRPPTPPYPPGAHDVVREARIQRALANSAIPVPRILAVEEGADTIGVPFYVMDHVDGHVVTAQTPRALDSPQHHRALAEKLVDTLAALHRVDPVALGLAEPAAPLRDAGRALRRRARLLDPTGSGLDGHLGAVQDRLLNEPPAACVAAVVHGDFRLGNVMLALEPPVRVIAVLDWELAGAGDPLSDLGYFLATYARPHEALHAMTELGRATRAPGFPERRELAARYSAATGTDTSSISWYLAAALWNVAVLFEHQRRRVIAGQGDPFYARPGLVDGLLLAAENFMEGMEA